MSNSTNKYSIATAPEIDELLNNNAPVAIGVSGGKDSHACAFAVTDCLNALGHSGPRLLIHGDLGRIEWKDSLPVAKRIAENLNMELVVVRRKAGDMIQRWESRWTSNLQRYLELSCVKLILPFSTPSLRFCTSEMKVNQISQYLKSRFPVQSVVSANGVRAEESKSRARQPVASMQPKLSSEKKGIIGWDWRPIHYWPAQDVFSYLHSKGEVLHEAYTKFGSSRVSCSFCIMSSVPDLKASATCTDNHEAYRLITGLEIKSTFSFHGNLWLSDIAPHLLSAEDQAAVAEAKVRACRRIEAEALIPKHMLFTSGWPSEVPTWEEAKLLGQVRHIVCESIEVSPTFTHPEEIILRYRELLTEKHGVKLFKKQELIAAA